MLQWHGRFNIFSLAKKVTAPCLMRRPLSLLNRLSNCRVRLALLTAVDVDISERAKRAVIAADNHRKPVKRAKPPVASAIAPSPTNFPSWYSRMPRKIIPPVSRAPKIVELQKRALNIESLWFLVNRCFLLTVLEC